MLRQTAREVCGVDVSEQCATLARQRLGPHVSVHHLGETWRVPDANRFDCVTMFQVLEHTSEYDKLFGSVASVLSPGGCLWLSTPNAVRRLAPGARPWNRFHVHEFRPDELAALLRRYFRKVRLEGLVGSSALMTIDEDRVAAKRLLAGVISRERTRNLPPSLLRPFLRPPTTEAECRRAFSTRDLWFVDDRLDEAIDLFATCEDPLPEAANNHAAAGESRAFGEGR